MVFSDLFFIFIFLPAFAILYLIAGALDKTLLKRNDGSQRFILRNAALVIFSLMFYAWGEPIYVFLMLVCVAINYLAGLLIAKFRWPKIALWLGVLLDLALLGTFKYLGFFGEIATSIGFQFDLPKLALPIGISFYIFQSISYLVDVYRKEAPVQKNFFNLLLYIALFPQLIAGPIVRYGSIAHEIHNRRVDANELAEGIYRFIIGLGKKVIIANVFSEIADLFLIQHINDLSIWGAWIGITAFALQIYFDFSGYSDMAIGIGRSVGFHFPENFNHPYCCRSVTDFWRRWHMTLGGFFRDYAYIPMGGNRRHQPINILTVWFLTGMWHGASWNFIFWGLYYGLVLVIEKNTLLRKNVYVPAILMHCYALVIILISWGLFYFTDIEQMTKFYTSMFGMGSHNWTILEENAIFDYFWLWIAALLLCMPLRRWLEAFLDRCACTIGATGQYITAVLKSSVSVAILVACIALLVGATNNAFIYTRF